MFAINVSTAVNREIDALDLPKKQAGQVRTCIGRYSKPKNFQEGIVKIVFRIWNAVKSIFGKSDWQTAKRIINKKFIKSDLFRTGPNKNVQKRICKDVLNKETKKFLNNLIMLNEN